jgi:hypothetical protein
MIEWNLSDRLAVALACLAGIMALALVWMDKTPLGAGITIGCMSALIVYPVLHFVRSPKARVAALVFSWVAIGVFGWLIWPHHATLEAPVATAKPPQQAPQPIPTPEAKDKSKPPAPPRPKHPIIITSIHAEGSPDVGKTLRVRVNIKNVSGSTLETTKYEGVFPVLTPRQGPETSALEERIWKDFIAAFDAANSPIEEIPTAQDGLFNTAITSPAFNEQTAQGIRNHSLVLYFTFVVRDNRTKKNLVEVCGYPQEDGSFTACARHNFP